ncbi:MAG: hypothetical protein AAGF24_00040 [Cyanobacteria bacterium P01_H01_bin.121]
MVCAAPSTEVVLYLSACHAIALQAGFEKQFDNRDKQPRRWKSALERLKSPAIAAILDGTLPRDTGKHPSTLAQALALECLTAGVRLTWVERIDLVRLCLANEVIYDPGLTDLIKDGDRDTVAFARQQLDRTAALAKLLLKDSVGAGDLRRASLQGSMPPLGRGLLS